MPRLRKIRARPKPSLTARCCCLASFCSFSLAGPASAQGAFPRPFVGAGPSKSAIAMTDLSRPQPPPPRFNEGSPIDVGEAISDIIAAQLGVARASVTSATTFEEMGADIYDMAEMTVSIEEAFGV